RGHARALLPRPRGADDSPLLRARRTGARRVRRRDRGRGARRRRPPAHGRPLRSGDAAAPYLSFSAIAVRSFHAIVELLSTSGRKSHGVIPQHTMSVRAVIVAVRSEPVRSAISPK